MVSASVAVVDALNSLLEAEADSIFRVMGKGSVYLERLPESLRPPILKLAEDANRHAHDLRNLIAQLGGTPVRTDHIQPDEHYLKFLPPKFLLPKLVGAKKLCVSRYENTLAAIGREAPPEVLSVLKKHLVEYEADLETLERVGGEIAVPSTR